MMTTRRGLLRGLGLAATAGVGASVPAMARSEYPHWDTQPEHVTLSYDEPTLLNHAPRLVLSQDAREKFQGLWGWTAMSPDYDRDWHVYVALYTHQEGLSPFAQMLSDSHLGDTEWYYVGSNPETGETERVIYDAYHWIAGRLDASMVTMDGEHPVARCVDPWHFYAHSDLSASAATAFDEIGDLTSKFDAMLANGLGESLQPGTVTDPVTMTSRGHWWRSGLGGFSWDATLARTMYSLGWVGAERTDSSGISL